MQRGINRMGKVNKSSVSASMFVFSNEYYSVGNETTLIGNA